MHLELDCMRQAISLENGLAAFGLTEDASLVLRNCILFSASSAADDVGLESFAQDLAATVVGSASSEVVIADSTVLVPCRVRTPFRLPIRPAGWSSACTSAGHFAAAFVCP